MYVSRSQRILQMALKVNESQNQVAIPAKNDPVPKQKIVQIINVEGEVFHPIVTNETESSASSGIPSSFLGLGDVYKTKLHVKEKSNSAEMQTEITFTSQSDIPVSHKKYEVGETSGCCVSESDFDDSDVDPTFEPPHLIKSPDLLRSDIEDDSSIERMAQTLENNIMEESPNYQTRKTRQRQRNLGKTYKTATGKPVKERKMTKLTPCIRKCNEKISESQQTIIFEEYWALGEYNLRRLYVCGLISIENKKTQRLVNLGKKRRNREYSYKYNLKVNEFMYQVCQKCFKYTLGETDKFLKTVIKHKLNSPGITVNLEGRRKNAPSNKLTHEKINEVKDHIESFPKYESHYSRNKSAQLYLECDLSIAKMYHLYCDTHDKPVSLSKYSEIFKTMNIKFKSPKVDTCNTCDKLQMQISLACGDEVNELREIQKQHHIKADLGFSTKKKDIAEARSSSNSKKVLIFDLQQVLIWCKT